jgi:CRISPR-associated protein Cas2
MRRLYLVAYDITNPKRLRRVHKSMKGFGDRIQYSVFLCPLAKRELIEMRWILGEIIDNKADQILILDLGVDDGEADSHFEFMGCAPRLPSGGTFIV